MSIPEKVDLLIVGGGINGAGIARDASGRGLSVLLCEQNDLASGTSSASTKLIHGGLRYLEHYDFRLVRDALIERERLLAQAPHLIEPMRFILPHQRHLRPKWLIRLGLFFYDHLAKRKKLPASKQIKLESLASASPLKAELKDGFEYSDCWVDDARLVVINALAAQQRGATVLTRTRCVAAKAQQSGWLVTLQSDGGEKTQVQAKVLVNAAGPWVNHFYEQVLETPTPYGIRLVKGSHLVVPKLYEGEHAYILQLPDERIIFTIPYQEDKTLIGTTDEVIDSLDHNSLSSSERDYLLQHVNSYFIKQITVEDILWSYSGVRPLLDDGSNAASEVTRDYKIVADEQLGAPLISLFGGKITTYRKVAEQVMTELKNYLPAISGAWTANDILPGGGLPDADFDAFLKAFISEYACLPMPMLKRLARNYGTIARQILDHKSTLESLGEHFGESLYQAEVDYLLKNEWAKTAEDILWRRTKVGLKLQKAEQQRLSEYIAEQLN